MLDTAPSCLAPPDDSAPPDDLAPSAKPHLHQSQISTYTHCGMQYYWRYVQGIKSPPGVAAITGTATHRSVEHNLKHKMATGELLPAEAVGEIARDALNAAWDEDGVLLLPDEREEGEKKIKGQAVDMAVRLATLHHGEIAPLVVPVSLERTFKLTLPHHPVDLVGTIDIEEERGIRDTKTFAKTPAQAEVDRSIQLDLYGLAKRAWDGRNPDYLTLDILLKSKKAPRAVSMTTTRTEDDYRTLLKRVESVCKGIESGVFIPTTPDDWRCSARWCGYFGICPFGSRRRVQTFIQKGDR